MKTKVVFGIVCVLLLFTVAARFTVVKAQSYQTVQGIAFCYHHPVVGVWIASTNSGSGWSERYVQVSGDKHIVSFYKTNMAMPANISIHVGCGLYPGTNQWLSDNHTPDIALNPPAILKVYCNDIQNGTTNNCQFVHASERDAYNWAEQQYLNKNTSYPHRCLTFVNDAYWKSAANIVNILHTYGFKLPVGREPYPSDIWPQIASHSVKGQVGTDTSVKNPPAGAWVFYMPPNPDQNYGYSHVTLSKGDGSMYSTWDSFNESDTIHIETIAEHDSVAYSHYVGWWLPDQ
jgi:hypothetical protein